MQYINININWVARVFLRSNDSVLARAVEGGWLAGRQCQERLKIGRAKHACCCPIRALWHLRAGRPGRKVCCGTSSQSQGRIGGLLAHQGSFSRVQGVDSGIGLVRNRTERGSDRLKRSTRSKSTARPAQGSFTRHRPPAGQPSGWATSILTLPYSTERATSRRPTSRRRIRRFFLASGDLCVTGELGMWRRLYISPTIRLDLDRLGLVYLPVRKSLGSVCLLPRSSGAVQVGGEQVQMLVVVCVVYVGVFCRGFFIDEFFLCCFLLRQCANPLCSLLRRRHP
jgi:hypothetical protein